MYGRVNFATFIATVSRFTIKYYGLYKDILFRHLRGKLLITNGHFIALKKAISILLWLSTIFVTNATSANSTDAEYEKHLRELHYSIGQLQQQLMRVKGSRNDLQQSLQKTEIDIGELTKKIDAIKEALDREKKQLAQLHAERLQLESSRHYQQEQIIDIINHAYKLGRQSHVKLLLSQQEPNRISRLLRYHTYFVQARAAKINDYIKIITQFDQLKGKIIASSNALKNKRQVLNKRYQQLHNSQADRLKVLAKLNTDLKNKSQHLSELQLDQKRLQKLLDEATVSLANLELPREAGLFRQFRGKLPKPVVGKVLHAYGSYRLSSQLTWKGIFYGGSGGSDVIVIHYGRVIFSDYLKGYGLLLIIDHGDGYMSLYAHNQTLYKEIGDWVSSKEVIAAVGNSGGLERSGLYFEIRYQGQPQDPKQWISPHS